MHFYVFRKVLKLIAIVCILGIGSQSYAQSQGAAEAQPAVTEDDADTTQPKDAAEKEGLCEGKMEFTPLAGADAATTAETDADVQAQAGDTDCVRVELTSDSTGGDDSATTQALPADSALSEKAVEEPMANSEMDTEKPCGSLQVIEKLQFEWTNADEKGSLLDQLAELEGDNLQKCLCTNTDRELMGVTVLDLSRHTNAELAQKAKALAEQFDSVACVNEMLSSTDPHRQENVAMFLLRIEPDQAREIFDKASFPEDDEGSQDKLYMGRIVFEGFISHLVPTVLIPTASEKGDLYYVKAEWDPENEEQFNCLSELFKETTLAERSLEQEKEWMKKRNGTRWVSWYSKEWAIGLAQGITKCDGKASFVKGPNS